MPPPSALRCQPRAVAMLLAAAAGVAACAGSGASPVSSPRSDEAGGAPSADSTRPGRVAEPGAEPARAASDESGPDAGAAGSNGPDGGSNGLRFEVRDARSTCSRDEDCMLTRYPGCCCSTIASAMPRLFAISQPDLEARKQWCDSHVERIECELPRCPPPAEEQPEPEPRTVACVDGLCVSQLAEP